METYEKYGAMEMDTLFFGSSEKAFFKLNDIQNCRSIIKPYYPPTNIEFIENKGKRKKTTKHEGEIRLMGVDLALMGGSGNDNSVFTLMRLLPKGESYDKHVVYIETLNGMHSEKQAVRIKQLFYDFECDFVVMDTAGNGLKHLTSL